MILAASSDLFSGAHTGRILEKLILTIFGHPLPPATFERAHFLLRKGAHLTEYAILGMLLFRAIRATAGPLRPWALRWALGAIVIAALVASLDEWHQTFIPSRTGSPYDVALDTAGATLGAAAFALRRRA